MHLVTGYEGKKARIEIVPLVDVVFLLLISFIYAVLSLSEHRGVNVQLPRVVGEDIPKSVIIAVLPDNRIEVDGETVGVAEAVTRAASMSQAGRPVIISGDRRADLGVAVQLLSGLQKAGIQKVSFKTRNEGQP